MINSYKDKINRRIIRYKKEILWTIKKKHKDTLPIFIMGCGRSGTSMMSRMFEYDDRIQTLGENNPKVQKNFMLLKSRVETVIDQSKAPVIVMKPILNSFETSCFLEKHRNLKILWLQRDYKDMVASSMVKFGSVVSDYMKELVLYNKGNNWLCSGMPLETLRILRSIETKNFNDYDWMCLVWWALNRTVIIDRLYLHERFFLIKYESFVSDPVSITNEVYEWLGLSYSPKVAKYIHSLSIGKGKNIQIDPVVHNICNQLTEEINSII